MLLSFKVRCRQNAPGYFFVTNEANSSTKLETPLFTAATLPTTVEGCFYWHSIKVHFSRDYWISADQLACFR